MNFRLLIKVIAVPLAIGLFYSCSKKHVQLTLLETKYYDVIEVRNGSARLFLGSVGGANMSGQCVVALVPVNFRDSISVRIVNKGTTIFNKSVKLEKGRFLYIENYGGEILIYSSKKEKPLI
ncbi:MAG: hypothetical protein WC150_15205 [Bacteroidia bacterium]